MALLDSGNLRLKGDGRIGGRLNMEIDGRIPLAAAKIFSDELADAAGILVLNGKIAGDTADPQIDARIDLENIGMTVPGLVQKLHDLNGSIHLTPDNIRIDALRGLMDTGSFSVDGSIAHETFTPTQVNLSIDAKSLPLEVPDTLAVLLNGDIKITGSGQTAAARGTLVLLEGVYYKDVKINLLQMATSRQRAVAPAAKPPAIPYFDTVNLNIAVSHRQPFVVQNNLAQLEISPELKIGGRPGPSHCQRPGPGERGNRHLSKEDLRSQKGDYRFRQPLQNRSRNRYRKPTPRSEPGRINLGIKGTPENLDITLTSQPDGNRCGYPVADPVRSNRPGTDRRRGRRPTHHRPDHGRNDCRHLGDDIKKNTGVDILQLETNDSSDGQNAAGVKVTVGKHLSDRMTVKYAVESKDGEVTPARHHRVQTAGAHPGQRVSGQPGHIRL